MVKSHRENEQAQYVQYVYDEQGNKVRQYTGMTSPLTLTVTESKTVTDTDDVFTYAGKTYLITMEGKKKSDTIHETSYECDEKNRLTSYTDPHGNVVQLTDESGKVVKTYEYDSFGKKGKEDEKDENPFRYCGEYYDKETEEVYLRARYYEPEVGRFMTRDTYTGEENEPLSLHLYAYCANDGVNMIDSSGHIPKPLAAVAMSQHIMKAKKKDIKRDTISKEWWFLDRYKNGGLRMGVYKSKKTGEYAIVNKGTTMKNLNNWKNNFQQPFGRSADMRNSIKKAKKYVKKYKRKRITFVGHSKGGAEAAANAVATNKNAILFNPAPVNLSAYGLGKRVYGYSAKMTAYIVKGEILSAVLGKVSKPIYNVFYLSSPHKAKYGKWYKPYSNIKNNLTARYKNHMLDAVKQALEKDGFA